jgi:hypothetical protein
MRNHKWNDNKCINCGIKREKKVLADANGYYKLFTL